MQIAETERLIIRQFTEQDTDFILRQLNDESFVRNIADKQVRTREDALSYLRNGPFASYQQLGLGLNLVQLKATGTPIGMCGILQRPELDYPDLGYAFLPDYQGQGFAQEAAEAVLKDAVTQGQSVILAVTLLTNAASYRLLERVGFELQGEMELYGKRNRLYRYQA
ncbi:GNAT family N-acetyltransferase [Oceanospirillum sanctuarii]|uniref:GNAT family N-acetyltransferase n=1 Tax=Oceanospirillum sanctuarii TaxID=1434821 RepID=UPI000A35EEAD|nr:GNAT family N-acetyltransferase [Oceanospirillum sanctuarii]